MTSEPKYIRIAVLKSDYQRIKLWQDSQLGLTLIGAVHQIIDTAEKHRKITHRNNKGQFDGGDNNAV